MIRKMLAVQFYAVDMTVFALAKRARLAYRAGRNEWDAWFSND